MKTLRIEEVFPLPLDSVWKLLHAHVDDARIREIHPWILRTRTTHEGDTIQFQGLSFPREKVAERLVKIGGRATETTWRYRIDPPNRYAYETDFANGSVTRFDNAYASAEGGTRVTTVGEISPRRVPSFLAGRLVSRFLNRTEGEDLAYARKMGLLP